jgi:hypothetical protein
VILAYAVAFSVGYFTLYIAIAKNASAGAYAWRSIREYIAIPNSVPNS